MTANDDHERAEAAERERDILAASLIRLLDEGLLDCLDVQQREGETCGNCPCCMAQAALAETKGKVA